ncbi:MAG: leucine-rich repeat domain-containing protein [Prevotella sp.]|nr:leucine-rich repeat domain-containing protein [Prevotella sp.]
MKKAFVFIFLITKLVSLSVAETIKVDGLCYKLNMDDKSAEVVKDDANYYPHSNLIIPSSISVDGIVYHVKSIGNEVFKNLSTLESVTISEGITSIGFWAFFGCNSLGTIIIPNSVTSIGLSAFDQTLWLDNQQDGLVYIGKVLYTYKGSLQDGSSLVIADGTLGIADNAFQDCKRELTAIHLPNSLKSIGSNSFSECSNLTSINLPSGLLSIGESAFFCCYSLTSLQIPNSVIDIGRMAFMDCSGITDLSISNSIEEIKQETFKGCRSLTSVTIPSKVKHIGYGAFSECTNLESVFLLEGLTSLDGAVFFLCSNLKSIAFPSSVTSIGGQAFMWCESLSSIDFLGRIIEIGYSAFEETAWLKKQPNGVVYAGEVAYMYKGEMPDGTSVRLNEGTKGIAQEAFYGLNGLTSIFLPSSIEHIGWRAISQCKNLTDVYCCAVTVPQTNPVPYASQGVFYGSQDKATLHVPKMSIEYYCSNDLWKDFMEIVEFESSDQPKCATPTIVYDKGELFFSCETEGVKFISEVKVADAKSNESERVTLTPTYVITVYATKDGYSDSEVATATIHWREGRPLFSGFSDVTIDENSISDVNADGEVGIGDIVAITNIMAGK